MNGVVSVDCTAVCNSNSTTSSSNQYHCYHMYESIPMASYYTLLNLFGEYPLITLHSYYGEIIATITSIIAVAVFAIPVGIIGNGLQSMIIKEQRQKKQEHRQQNQKQKEQFNTTTSNATTTITTIANATTTTTSDTILIFPFLRTTYKISYTPYHITIQ
jgi:hypothetical protein